MLVSRVIVARVLLVQVDFVKNRVKLKYLIMNSISMCVIKINAWDLGQHCSSYNSFTRLSAHTFVVYEGNADGKC
jgi:hypothetical protein